MAYYVGEEITERYTLLDASEPPIPITGATFVLTTADPSGSSFAVDVTELGSGLYQFRFTPTSAGDYYFLAQYTGDPPRALQGSWNVDQAAVSPSAIAVTGGLTLSRQTLRRRIAGRMGDLLIMQATAGSISNSTFIDELNVNIVAENLDGRMLLVTTGANAGHIARVQSKTISTSTITFTPPAPTTFAAGDEIELVNAHSRGFTISEYNRAINDAINDAWPRFKLEYLYAPTDAYSSSTGSITIPAEMSHVYEVQWQNGDDSWISVRKGKWYGWRGNPALGTITILSDPSPFINGKQVRLLGYGRHPELTSDTDQCAIPAEWLVARACYHLSLSGIDKENAKANAVLTFQREAEMLMRRTMTVDKPTTERVH